MIQEGKTYQFKPRASYNGPLKKNRLVKAFKHEGMFPFKVVPLRGDKTKNDLAWEDELVIPRDAKGRFSRRK